METQTQLNCTGSNAAESCPKSGSECQDVANTVEAKESNDVTAERKVKKPRSKTEEKKPEKKQKKAQLAGDDAETAVFEYMKMQNRPYSAQNIFDNLHGSVGKANLQRILDALSTNRKLISKEFGKFKVYLVNQTVFGDPSTAEENERLDKEICATKEEIPPLEAQVKQLRQAVTKAQGVSDQTSKVAKLRQDLNMAERELAELKERRASTSESAIDPTETHRKHQLLHMEWHKRKKVCESLLSVLCQSVEMKQSDLIIEIGIDTDEDCIPVDAYCNY